MEMDRIPLFDNNCGKIFKDRVVLFSPVRESQVKIDAIERLEFVTKITVKSFIWVLISSSFFFLLYLQRNLNEWLFAGITFTAFLFTLISVALVERNYQIVIHLHDGSTRWIRVTSNNKKEAKKLIEAVKENHKI